MALMKKLTSALVASSLVLSLVGTAAAATQDQIQFSVDRMQSLGLVKGRGGNDGLALESPITRAELVTVIVRAFGQEENAQYLKGAAAFKDTANHWASGNIAMAKRLMEARAGAGANVGYPDGTFRPNANVTGGEAVAFVMKFIGAQPDNTLAWPDNYLQGALNAGIISAEDLAYLETVKNQPAQRGLAFYLADNAFSSYKLAEGSTVYQTFVDRTAPVLTLGEVPQTTLEPKVTVSGTASGAEAVYVNGQPAALTDGTFTAEVELALGENAITVTAVDLVGNTTEQVVKVTRTTGAATAIEASDITVAAGETIDVGAAVVDAYGNALEAEITGESNVGTYADGKFTASTMAGEGTLTLKSGELSKTVKVTVVAGPLAKVEGEKASAAPGEPLKLVGKDQYGNIVEGVTFSEDSADAVIDGNIFIGTKAGKYTVKGVKDDVTVESTIGVYGDVEKLVVTAPEKVVGNGATEYELTVAAVDENGIIVGDYDGLVEVDESDLDITDSTVEAKNGVATFKFKAASDWAGQIAEVSFVDADDDNIKGSVEVKVEEQVATSIELDAPKYMPTNALNDIEVKVIVKDQVGEDMAEGGWDFDIKVSGPAELANGKQSFSDYLTTAANTFTVSPTEVGETGDVVVTVSSEGLGSATATIKAAVAKDKNAVTLDVDDATKTVADYSDPDFELDDALKFTVTIVDKYGVPVPNATDNLKIKFEDLEDNTRTFIYFNSTEGWIALNADEISHQLQSDASGKVTFYVTGEVADTFKVSVVDPQGVLKSSSAKEVTLEAGDPAVVAFENSALTLRKAKTVSTELTAQLYDEFGNKAAVSGAKVTFDVYDDESDGTDDEWSGLKLNDKSEAVDVRTDANGQAKVSVKITATDFDPVAGVGIKVTGEYSGDPLNAPTGSLSDTIQVALSNSVPESISAYFVDDLSDTTPLKFYTLADGDDANADPDGFILKIVVKDEYDDPFQNLEDKFEFEATSDEVEEALATASVTYDPTEGAYYVAVAPTEAGSLSVTVKLPEYGLETTTKAISVKAGVASDFEVVEATDYSSYDGMIRVDAYELTPITIRLTDAWGNAASSNPETIRVYFTATDEGTSTDNKAPFLEVRDADGTPLDYVELRAGRTSAKVYILTNSENGELGIEAYVKSGDEWDKDTGATETDDQLFGTSLTIAVNPAD